MNNKGLVEKVATSFEQAVNQKLSKRLKSFYIVGSYAFGKVSEQRPDVNFLLIFNNFISPEDYLAIGEICRNLEDKYAKKATIKIEFRPFRYIKPRYKNDFEISINPIIISTGEIKAMGGVIFNKWFTQGLKSTNKLLSGDDYLSQLKVDKISREDLKKGAAFDLAFFSLPVSRAPAQYTKSESNLLLNESLVNAKNIAYFGIEAAMNDKELAQKDYVKYMQNKDKMVAFYAKRYGKDAARMVERVLRVRNQYLKFKNDPKVAQEIFSIALTLANIVRAKVYSG